MNNKRGSALIMVLFITSILLITATTSWYIAFLLHEASMIRQRCLQHAQAAKGLLMYATHKAAKKFDSLYASESSTMLYQGQWPAHDQKKYYGCATALKKDSAIKVYVILQEHGRVVAQISSLVEINPLDVKKDIIVGWNMHEDLL